MKECSRTDKEGWLEKYGSLNWLMEERKLCEGIRMKDKCRQESKREAG